MKNDERLKKNNDIFKEAMKVATTDSIAKGERNKLERPQYPVPREINASMENSKKKYPTKWGALTDYMVNEGAERIRNELDNLPPKDFVRVYIKLLEYFKPKISRTEFESNGEDDNTVSVKMIQKLPNGDTQELEIRPVVRRSEESEDTDYEEL